MSYPMPSEGNWIGKTQFKKERKILYFQIDLIFFPLYSILIVFLLS